MSPGLRAPVWPSRLATEWPVEIDAAAFGRRAAEQQRGAGRRVDLLVVMHLQDFDVERLVERLRHALRQRRQQIDAEAHIAGLDDHGGLCRVLDLRIVARRYRPVVPMTCTLPALAASAAKPTRRHRRGEIDDAVGLRQQRPCVAGQFDAVLGKAGQHACIPADQRRARVFQGARKRKLLVVGDRLDQRAAHPPAGTGDHKPHLGHGSISKTGVV